jgi:hypothetical protein
MTALPPFGFTGRVQFTRDCFRKYAVGLGDGCRPRTESLRECLAQVRYVAAANRSGIRRLWVSRELRLLLSGCASTDSAVDIGAMPGSDEKGESGFITSMPSW